MTDSLKIDVNRKVIGDFPDGSSNSVSQSIDDPSQYPALLLFSKTGSRKKGDKEKCWVIRYWLWGGNLHLDLSGFSGTYVVVWISRLTHRDELVGNIVAGSCVV